MLTPGISVKNVTFRREGFKKGETMNRKKTKNLLVLMVLSSAAAAGYLVFYNHEPGERELVEGMHIDGALDGESAAAHHHRVKIDDIGRKGKKIGDKLYVNGVPKVKSLAERLKERLREKEKQDEQEEIQVGMGGAVNLEEQEEKPVYNEKKAEDINSLRERLKARLQQRKKLKGGAVKSHSLVDKANEKDWGVADNKEDDLDQVEKQEKVAPVVPESAEEVVEEAQEEENVEKPKAKAMSLMERLRARLAEQKKEQEAKDDESAAESEETTPSGEEEEDPFGAGAAEESQDESNVEAVTTPSEESAGDDPFGPGGGDAGEGEVVEAEAEAEVVTTYRPVGKFGLRPIGDILKAKKYGIKKPNVFGDDDEDKDAIEPFDDRAFNRKPKLGIGEDDVPDIKPVARPVHDDPELKERVRQHINELNGGIQGDVEDDGMPRREQGMGAFQRKENPFLKKKAGAFDSGHKKKKNPFLKKKFSPFDAMKKGKKEDGFGAFHGKGRESIDDIGVADKKEDGFGAFRGAGNDVGDDDIGIHKPPKEEEESQFINKKGLVKAGGGAPIIRPFGNKGMNPFLDHGFKGVKGKKKVPALFDNDGPKVNFDFRNLDKQNKKPGLLVEDDEGDAKPAIQQALPPRPPAKEGAPVEIPVPAPIRGSLKPAKALGRIPGMAQIPILHPDHLNQRLKEVPVAPPIKIAAPKIAKTGYKGKLQIHSLSKPTKYNGAKCQRYIFPAPVGAGKICLHKPKTDLVSDTIMKDGQWEHQMVTEMTNILNTDWKMGLIDVGAGIGMFSLCAALMHRQVVAIEPFFANYMTLHKAAMENSVGSRITLLTHALGGSSYTGRMTLASRDEGGYSSVHINKPEAGETVEKRRAVNVTTLNVLAEKAAALKTKLFAKSNLLKLDVSDNKEADILEAGTDFFKTVDVNYILTHWRKSRAEKDHLRLMTSMAKLRFQPQLTWNGDVIEMENLQMDQMYIVWVKVHTLEGA